MALCEFLDSRRQQCRDLVRRLQDRFAYVSILGSDCVTTQYRADRSGTQIRENGRDRGFVLRLHNGASFMEYALSDITEDPDLLVERIMAACMIPQDTETISCPVPEDEPLKRDWIRETDLRQYSDSLLLEKLTALRDTILSADERVANAFVILSPMAVNKLFISPNRELSQSYSWINGRVMGIWRDGDRIVQPRTGTDSHLVSDVLQRMPLQVDELLRKARLLASASPIEPGVYDVITDPSITGLIAHEAFGHGVEMDQFVKNRALAKQYMGKPVASPITNMRDGAGAALSVASYFFDDDGIPAHDTQIIRDGVLVSGLSDIASACQLGTAPTGNGRRQATGHKAYTRMTNTFFVPGTDKLEDMIASIRHGYMLFETDNGMEDPKNWQIQCTAQYGLEIVDGKLTDRCVAPVVISGSVPDLLHSISMVSDDLEIDGGGFCGKGYKEWVRVSDGGPALKVRAKLG